ncbi:MAG: hypothetical protein ACRDQA_05745 [Nocardioidaceae bacterium]
MSDASVLARSVANNALAHSGAPATATATETADGHIDIHFSVPPCAQAEVSYWEHQVRAEVALIAPYSELLAGREIVVKLDQPSAPNAA